MNFEEFKQKCEKQKKLFEEKKNRFKNLKKEQEKYLDICYKPKRKLFKYYCPVCGKVLKRILIECVYFDYSEDIIYECNCGYEYAITE